MSFFSNKWKNRMLTDEEIKRRTTYHAPTPEAIGKHEMVRGIVTDALFQTDTNIPDCREKSLAITKLEEYMFWANAAIARNHEKL
jgi:hypothetical protein